MTALPPTAPVEPDQFIARLRQSLADGSFVSLALGRPHDAEPALDKLLVRRLVLRGVEQLSLVWRHRTKDITKNLPVDAALGLIASLVAEQFHHAHLVTRGHDIQLVMGKKGRWSLRIGKLAAPALPAGMPVDPAPAAGHDRARQRALALDTPFLTELGITDGQQRLVPAMARKWRQINKFAEVLAHAIAQSPLADRDPALPVRVLDFGAGKGYLTFAVHHQLLAHGRLPEVIGVELRDDLTTLCNSAVARLGLTGLHFATGDVGQFDAGSRHATQPGDASIDIMIALHACDTATDVAMHHGIRARAAIIVCSPCCHKQLRPQMRAPALLAPMLGHGIHMTEQAEMLTDSLRALLLQAEGYEAQVFEFVAPEHSGKNKMVLAVRRASPLPAAQRATLLAQVDALKAHYGVTAQHLESLLMADTLADAGAAALTRATASTASAASTT